jgi:hypothetical protein
MLKFWAYSLLLSFAFLVTPKTLLHSHEHSHEHSDHDGLAFDDDGCFVCDFDYTNLSAPVGRIVQLNLIAHSELPFSVETAEVRTLVDYASLRGPPSIS